MTRHKDLFADTYSANLKEVSIDNIDYSDYKNNPVLNSILEFIYSWVAIFCIIFVLGSIPLSYFGQDNNYFISYSVILFLIILSIIFLILSYVSISSYEKKLAKYCKIKNSYLMCLKTLRTLLEFCKNDQKKTNERYKLIVANDTSSINDFNVEYNKLINMLLLGIRNIQYLNEILHPPKKSIIYNFCNKVFVNS